MSIKIALAGNPNSGKTTLFNALTGSNQFVGNWPGVTVEKKEGKLKGRGDVAIIDLPGIYSLSPYSPEELVARNYLTEECPDAILNIVDGTSLERNLFLTTQLTELGIPVVVALNMMDVVNRNEDVIDIALLAGELGCPVAEISALKGTGIMEAAEAAVAAAGGAKGLPRNDIDKEGCRVYFPAAPMTIPQHSFSGGVEHTLAHIEEAVLHHMPQEKQRFYAIKLFERDANIIEKLGLDPGQVAHIEEDIRRREDALDDDSESIITTERYAYIDSIISDCLKIKNKGRLSASDKIDKVVTNRILALPVFIAVMFIVYFISVTVVGGFATQWAEERVFGEGWHLLGIGSAGYDDAYEAYINDPAGEEPQPGAFGIWVPGIPAVIEGMMESAKADEWLKGLVIDGMTAGVGAVLAFVPLLLVLFLFLAFLERCGYMARIAFILDRIFRKFGLSGKSFIPILIGTGCGVPGIMASRTIESERDRRMTVATTTFIPCAAKLPVIALIAGSLFGGAWWVAPSAYFIGIAAIICSGVILKKTKLFSGVAAPFIMELPAYHWPTVSGVLQSMWERTWSFVKKAGTVILIASVVIWFASGFGWEDGFFTMVDSENSILAAIGGGVAWVFAPLGWGNWQSAVAALTGLIAKENIVATFGVLFGFAETAADAADGGTELWGVFAAHFTALSAYSFLVFNLLCAPCVAAVGAIRREMGERKWFWFAIGYQSGFAYIISLCVYQTGMMFSGVFGFWQVIAVLLAGLFLIMLFRKPPANGTGKRQGNQTLPQSRHSSGALDTRHTTVSAEDCVRKGGRAIADEDKKDTPGHGGVHLPGAGGCGRCHSCSAHDAVRAGRRRVFFRK